LASSHLSQQRKQTSTQRWDPGGRCFTGLGIGVTDVKDTFLFLLLYSSSGFCVCRRGHTFFSLTPTTILPLRSRPPHFFRKTSFLLAGPHIIRQSSQQREREITFSLQTPVT
jgi:hypothetical protein